MALFGKKKTEVEETGDKTVSTPSVQALLPVYDRTAVIVKPRITEKSALLTDQHVYVFEVRKGANKHEIRDAIKTLYKVTPVSVRIVNKQPRHFMSRARGRSTMEHGLRKAYVQLKKDERIDLV